MAHFLTPGFASAFESDKVQCNHPKGFHMADKIKEVLQTQHGQFVSSSRGVERLISAIRLKESAVLKRIQRDTGSTTQLDSPTRTGRELCSTSLFLPPDEDAWRLPVRPNIDGPCRADPPTVRQQQLSDHKLSLSGDHSQCTSVSKSDLRIEVPPLHQVSKRLPVPLRAGGSHKMVAGYMLPTLASQVEQVKHMVQRLQTRSLLPPDNRQQSPTSTPRPPTNAAPEQETTSSVQQPQVDFSQKEFVPAPPPGPKPVKTRPAFAIRRHTLKVEVDEVKERLQSLPYPSKSLSLCLKQLSSDNWKDKVEGLRAIRTLGQHHPKVLLTRMQVVCGAVLDEVNSKRSTVACDASYTIVAILEHLGKIMDPMADVIGSTLLSRLAHTKDTFTRQWTNRALDILVKKCSPSKVLRALFNTGLNHLNVSVRESTATHLLQLMHRVGVDRVLTLGKTFSESFVIAVCKMATDAASEVRHPGLAMLEELALQGEFQDLWDKLIPTKDQAPLNKILQKLRRLKK